MKKENSYSRETNIEHDGYNPDLSVGSVMSPIFTSTTYQFKSAEAGEKSFKDALKGKTLSNLIYSRVNHPNAEILEDRLVNIELHGVEAAIFGSGMAAIMTTVLGTCPQNKIIAYTNPLYGGTYHFLNGYLRDELGYSLLELSNDISVSCKQLSELGEKLGLLYIETPANPTLQMFDIKKLCTAVKKASPGSYAVLDNTFMGIFQQGFGISDNLDLVVYSGTKFIGGHSDVLNGIVICREESKEVMKKIKSLRIIFGNILHPFECSQVLTHLNTYKIRMEEQSLRATHIAKYLYNLPNDKILKIIHPSLFKKGTPEYKIYKKQCSGGSSLICLWLNSDKAGAFRFLNELKKSEIIQLAVSLGGVESLASHPASTTHSEMDKETLNRMGITDNLIRFSIGLENPNDLIKVILQSLSVV